MIDPDLVFEFALDGLSSGLFPLILAVIPA